MKNNIISVKDWRDQIKPFYFDLGSVYSKAIKENVVFNNHGWKHLVYHKNGRRRNEKDIRLRLGLIKNVPVVIKNCKVVNEIRSVGYVTYFEISHTFRFNKKGVEKLVEIVVVIRKFEDQNPHFWTTRYGKKTKKTL